MKKRAGSTEEKELLKQVDSLIDGKSDRQRTTSSFLGFCSRLLGVNPKAEEDFRSSLEQELLLKHGSAEESSGNLITAPLDDVGGRKKKRVFKRIALVGIPALALGLLLAFLLVFTPQGSKQGVALAMEIVENDPQVQSVIEEYDLQVHRVETRGSVAYVWLDIEKYDVAEEEMPMECAIKVDLENETVGKIVIIRGEVESDVDDIESEDAGNKEDKAGAIDKEELDKKELKEKVESQYKAFEAEAKTHGMTVEEYKEHLMNQKY